MRQSALLTGMHAQGGEEMRVEPNALLGFTIHTRLAQIGQYHSQKDHHLVGEESEVRLVLYVRSIASSTQFIRLIACTYMPCFTGEISIGLYSDQTKHGHLHVPR